MTTPKTAVKPSKKPTERELELEKQVQDLQYKLDDLQERLRYADEAKASAREASQHLAKELEQVRKERDVYAHAPHEVSRLEGVLQGLERAGKIEPAPDVVRVDGYATFPPQARR